MPLDFLTTHHYGVDVGFLDEWGNTGTVLSTNGYTIRDAVQKTRAQMEETAKAGVGLHYTEWSTSYTPSDPVHDSYHSAAYLLHNLKGIGNTAQSMSYWTFTDIFEEAGPRFTPFHGGFGLTNYQGIHKPAYFAYKFFNQLGSIELANDDPESWVTKDPQGGLQALIWEFNLTRPEGEVNNQDFFNTDLPSAEMGTVRLQVSNMTPGKYRLTGYKVGYRANDAYTAYLDLGSPDQLTRAQVEQLKDVSSGLPFFEQMIEIGTDGELTQVVEIRENDVFLFDIEPM